MKKFLLLTLALAAAPAHAGCSVGAPTLDFGPLNPLEAAPAEAFAPLSVTCSAPTGYTISLSAGDGAYAARRMRAGGATLEYNLYLDAARSIVWGDGSGGSATAPGHADGTTLHTVYGRVPAQPLATPGIYFDTIVVSVDY